MYSFDQIKGNEFIISSLQNAIKLNKISHSYILNGASGTGKKLLSYAFAKTLLCDEGGLLSCNKCISCRSFEDFNNPDVIFVKPMKTKSIGVDDIREQILSTVSIKPYKYKYKIYIIENGNDMTVQAQNALLKTIEEPPAYGVFLILSTNVNTFLDTVLSRCVVKNVLPLNIKIISDYLLENGIDAKEADIYANYSNGSLGQALKLSKNEEFNDFRNDVIGTISNLETKNIKTIFKNVKILEKYKDDIDEALEIMYLFYRDALIYKSTSDESLIFEIDKISLLKNFSNRFSLKRIIEGIGAITDAKTNFRFNSNFILTLEVMFLKMAGL